MPLPFALLALTLGVTDIPLTLSNPAGVDARAWPVTVGIPFPPDALDDPGKLALLDGDGTPVPFQAEVTSRWWQRGGGVQTVALSFVADTRQPAYTLRIGGAPAPVPDPVRVEQDDDGVTVVSGVLRARFDRRRPGLLAALAVDVDGDGAFSEAETVIDPGRPSASTMGAMSSLTGPVASIEVEEAGPLRAVVRLRGQHGDGADRAIGYDVRAFLYAGVPYVRLEHTFVQDTDAIFYDVPSIGLDLPLGERATVTLGTEGAPATAALAAGDALTALQVGPGADERVETLGDNWDRHTVPLRRTENGGWAYEEGIGLAEFHKVLEERLPYASDEEKRMWSEGARFRAFEARVARGDETLHTAERLPGWVQVQPDRRPWVLSAGVRHFWQQHPKSIGWADGTLRLGLYAGDLIGEPLHFHTGTAKTHTIDLWVHPAADAAVGAAWVGSGASGPLYFAPASWYCASKVWGDIVERRPERFGLYEGEVDREMERFMTALSPKPSITAGYGGEFGLIGFGDYGGGARSLNLETAMDHGFAMQFLRTADRRVFDRFDLAVRHFRDIDVRQAIPAGQPYDYGLWLTPGYMPEAFAAECARDEALMEKTFFFKGEHPPQLGGVYRHGFRHYGMDQAQPYPPYSSRTEAVGQMYAGSCNVSGHGWAVGLVDHFLLTGDRRSLEVAELVGGFVLEHGGTSWGRDNWKYRNLARLYRATGDEAYLTRLREALDVIHADRESIVERTAAQDRTLMSPYYTILQFVAEMHRLTGEEAIKRKYLEMIDPWLAAVPYAESGIGPVFGYLRDYKDSRCHTDFADLAYAYLLTGDRRYLENSVRSADFYLHFAYHPTAWFSIPEYLYALDHAGIDALADPPGRQRLDTAYVAEAADAPFEVVAVQEQGYRVAAAPTTGSIRVIAPSGEVAAEKAITMGGTDVHRLSVPADGEAGLYTVEANTEGCWYWLSSTLPLRKSPPPVAAAGRDGGGVRLSSLARMVLPSEGRLALDEGTVEFWVQPQWDSPVARTEKVDYHYNHIFDSRDAAYDHGIAIYTYDGGEVGARKSLIAAVAAKDAADNVSIPLDWKAGEWHHVAFAWRRDGGLLRLYVDGELVASKEGATLFPAVLNPSFTLGSNTPATWNAAANVVLDNLRIAGALREPRPEQRGADESTLLWLDFEEQGVIEGFAAE